MTREITKNGRVHVMSLSFFEPLFVTDQTPHICSPRMTLTPES